MEQELIFRGIAPYHMAAYLTARSYRQTAEGVFRHGGICVRLGEAEVERIGSIALTVVRLRFEGPEAAVTEAVEAFRKHFMTAGG